MGQFPEILQFLSCIKILYQGLYAGVLEQLEFKKNPHKFPHLLNTGGEWAGYIKAKSIGNLRS